jgi:serine/threonine protein kinase
VFEARAPSGKIVALKTFSDALTRQPNFLTVFEQAASQLTSLVHPNALPLLDAHWSRAGGYSFTVEFASEGSLRRQLAGGPMPVDQALSVATQICRMLGYAHRRGLPHQHLVAENVFVDASGQVRVSDFGLARLERPIVAGVADVAQDVFDLAKLLYEMLSGGAPGTEPSPLASGSSGPLARIDAVLARALSTDPAQRFQRASEFAVALSPATEDAPAAPVAATPTVTFSVENTVVVVPLSEDANTAIARSQLAEVGKMLARKGPWRLGYDLSGMRLLEDDLRNELLRLHERYQRNLARLAFSSPRSLVRSGALVVGNAAKGVPWKVFADQAPMRSWLGEEAAR